MNKEAFEQLSSIKDNNKKKIVIVSGATHLFEEPGKLEKVAELATEWFVKYLG
jgi:putative phosphoribosyl transferase